MATSIDGTAKQTDPRVIFGWALLICHQMEDVEYDNAPTEPNPFTEYEIQRDPDTPTPARMTLGIKLDNGKGFGYFTVTTASKLDDLVADYEHKLAQM